MTDKLILPSGEVVEIFKIADRYCCPVCGLSGFDVPPWSDEEGKAYGSWEECPCCGMFFGYTDSAEPESPVGLQAALWREFRLKWLRTVDLNEANVRQLSNIGISRSEAEALFARARTD